jgi:molybdopterin converting factor small subunit
LSVKIELHRSLAKLADDQVVVEVDGNTVGQCLEQLAARFSKLKKRLFEKDGALSRILEIYVNGESAHLRGVRTNPLKWNGGPLLSPPGY